MARLEMAFTQHRKFRHSRFMKSQLQARSLAKSLWVTENGVADATYQNSHACCSLQIEQTKNIVP
uniref:Uncharacterized protein n=1 Tax=Rhizophora mucronata TaxID=61149 RepID=A0A2P2J7Y3_RHIMU